MKKLTSLALAIVTVASISLVAQAPQGTARAQAARGAAAAGADRWESSIARFEAQDKTAPPPKQGIVFVGSSSIVRWDLPKFFPELGAKAINRGFGGSQLADSVKYVDRIVTPYEPRIVVLYAGDNDIEAGVTPNELAAQFAEFDRKVHAKLPQTRTIFISIKPSTRRWAWMPQIQETNRLVREYIASRPHLIFMDIEQQMLGPDGTPNKALLVEDGLHMTPAGYDIWTAKLKPLLK